MKQKKDWVNRSTHDFALQEGRFDKFLQAIRAAHQKKNARSKGIQAFPTGTFHQAQWLGQRRWVFPTGFRSECDSRFQMNIILNPHQKKPEDCRPEHHSPPCYHRRPVEVVGVDRV